jgi:hypothetical protein
VSSVDAKLVPFHRKLADPSLQEEKCMTSCKILASCCMSFEQPFASSALQIHFGC